MLKVLLADDEAKVLRHLQTAIPWEQLELEIIATAQTGLDALRIARQAQVDIVITDIRMPGMDGLLLCQKLREQNPRVQLIILSGFQDFAYAKKAIELQVLGYCLKPIDTGDLTGLLRTAIRNTLKNKIENGDALLDLIEDGNSKDIRAAFHELGITSSTIYVAASVGVHNIEKLLGAQLSYRLGKHKYLYFSALPFNRANAEHMIAYATGRAGIGLYPEPVTPEHLKDAIEDTSAMAFQFFVNGHPTLCDSLVNGPLVEDVFARLENAAQQPELLKLLLEELSHANCGLIFNIQTVFIFCNRVASYLAFGGNNEYCELMLYGFEQLPANYLSMNALFSEFASEITPTLLQNGSDSASSSRSGSFLPIIRYLDKNYEKDLSLKKVAEHFHLNASYISQLIRSETGLTYTQYVTELRINKAKDLLKTTSLSLAEISEAVGFNDYFYFIKRFKKEVGVTPGKYLINSATVLSGE
jgi:two-component system, response regulator YesN